MHRLLRFIGLTLGVFTLALVPARGGHIERRADGTTVIHVKVFGLPDPNQIDPASRANLEVLKMFRADFPKIFAERYRARYEAHPGAYGPYDWSRVEVELEQFTGILVEGVETDLLAIAGGLAPDVLYINFRKSDNYIRSGFLYPLDKPDDGYLSALTEAEINARVHPKIWPVIRRKGPDGQKHVWAMPYGGALGKVLVYRKDLFDEHEIPYPTEHWTWDDMMAACKKLTDPKGGTYGLMLGRGKHESWFWITFLWSAGAEVMTYNEATDEWTCTFNGPGAAEALDFYTRLSAERWVDAEGRVRRGYAAKEAADTYPKWERGEIGMMYDYVDEKLISGINPELTGMAPVPLGPGNHRGGELNSRMMGLFAVIPDRAVRDAAWEWMRYFTSREAEQVRTRVMVEGGLGRFVNPKYLEMFGYPEIVRLSPPGWVKTFEIALATGQPEPCGKNSNLAYELMTEPMQKAEQLMLADKLPKDEKARLAELQEILDGAVARANEQMIGVLTPKQQSWRRRVASAVLLAIVVTFAWVFAKIAKTFAPPVEPGQKRGWQFVRYRWAYLLLLPAALTIIVWQYVPLLRGSVMAVQDYQLLRPSAWIGVDNFGAVLFDMKWWSSVWNALRYSFLIMLLTFLPPVVLAIFLQEVPRGKIFFRTVYYLPAVITGIVTVLLWKLFYEPSERGALNAVMLHIPAIVFVVLGLVLFGLGLAFARRLWLQQLNWTAWCFVGVGVLMMLTCFSLARPILFPPSEASTTVLQVLQRLFARPAEPYRWLGDPSTAMVSCIIPMVWAGMGPGCLIYLAALRGIPDDYYEAADLDGASFIDQILFVVFPTIKSLVIINFVGAFIGSWYGSTGNVLVMTGGAANTEVAGLYIWYKAFTFLQFGPATAAAWLLGFMLIGFTVHQLRILSRVEFKTTEEKK